MTDFKLNIENWIVRGDQKEEDRRVLEKYMEDNGIESRADLTESDMEEYEKAKQMQFSSTRLHSPDGTVYPFAYGGSDMAAIYGKSPWTTPVDLYYSKMGLKKAVSGREENLEAKQMGHKMEPTVREWFQQATGFPTNEFSLVISNKKYPHAVANVDGLVETPEGVGIFEAKTTSSENYRKIQEWKKGEVPLHYQMQCWFYMAVLELPFTYICCVWGLRSNAMAYHRIDRLPEDKERAFMEYAEKFVDDCAGGIIPGMGGAEPAQIIKSLSETVGTAPEASREAVRFGSEYDDGFTRYLELREQLTEKEGELSAFRKSKEAEMKPLKAEMKELEAKFAEELFDQTDGDYENDVLEAHVNFDYTTKRKTFDKTLCMSNYPKIFEEVYYAPVSEEREVKVSIVRKAGA